MVANGLLGGALSAPDNKVGERCPLECGSLLKKLFLFRRDTSLEALLPYRSRDFIDAKGGDDRRCFSDCGCLGEPTPD